MQFFAFNLENFTLDRIYSRCLWQIWGMGICWPRQTQISFSDQAYCFWHVHKYLAFWPDTNPPMKSIDRIAPCRWDFDQWDRIVQHCYDQGSIVDQHTGLKPDFNCYTHSVEREIWVFLFVFRFGSFRIFELFIVGLLRDLSLSVTFWMQMKNKKGKRYQCGNCREL